MSSKFYIDLDDAGVSEAAQTFLTRALGFMADNETGGFLSVADSKKLGLSRIPGRIAQLESEGIMVRVCAVSEDHRCAISVSSVSYPCSISAPSASSSVSHPCSHRGWNFPAWMKWQEPLERQVRKKKADRERVARKRSATKKVARQSSGETRNVAGHSNSNQEQELSTYVESSPHVSNAGAKRGRGMRAVDAINETARPVEVYRFMNEYERASSTPIDPKTLSQIETAVTPLFAVGIPRDQIADGIRAWEGSDSFSPTQIAAFVHKAGAKPAVAATQSTADQRVIQAQALKANRTGSSWPDKPLELT